MLTEMIDFLEVIRSMGYPIFNLKAHIINGLIHSCTRTISSEIPLSEYHVSLIATIEIKCELVMCRTFLRP